jgi:hypothetical protein
VGLFGNGEFPRRYKFCMVFIFSVVLVRVKRPRIRCGVHWYICTNVCERLAATIFGVVKSAENRGKYLLWNICNYVTIVHGVITQKTGATIINGIVKGGNIRTKGRQCVRVYRKLKQSKHKSNPEYFRMLSGLIVVYESLVSTAECERSFSWL